NVVPVLGLRLVNGGVGVAPASVQADFDPGALVDTVQLVEERSVSCESGIQSCLDSASSNVADALMYERLPGAAEHDGLNPQRCRFAHPGCELVLIEEDSGVSNSIDAAKRAAVIACR